MRTKFILLIVFSFFSYLKLNAQSINDFQSHQSGNWNQTSTCERWDGTTWVTRSTESLKSLLPQSPYACSSEIPPGVGKAVS